MSDFVGTLFDMGSSPVLEQAMQFNELRHRLILSNIANADTPEYRRQDVDDVRFKELLGRAIQERDERHPGAFLMPAGGRAPVKDRFGFTPDRFFRMHSNDAPLRHDGNDVSMEREMALLAQNAGKYQLYSRLLAKNYGQMRAAINERPEG